MSQSIFYTQFVLYGHGFMDVALWTFFVPMSHKTTHTNIVLLLSRTYPNASKPTELETHYSNPRKLSIFRVFRLFRISH